MRRQVDDFGLLLQQQWWPVVVGSLRLVADGGAVAGAGDQRGSKGGGRDERDQPGTDTSDGTRSTGLVNGLDKRLVTDDALVQVHRLLAEPRNLVANVERSDRLQSVQPTSVAAPGRIVPAQAVQPALLFTLADLAVLIDNKLFVVKRLTKVIGLSSVYFSN